MPSHLRSLFHHSSTDAPPAYSQELPGPWNVYYLQYHRLDTTGIFIRRYEDRGGDFIHLFPTTKKNSTKRKYKYTRLQISDPGEPDTYCSRFVHIGTVNPSHYWGVKLSAKEIQAPDLDVNISDPYSYDGPSREEALRAWAVEVLHAMAHHKVLETVTVSEANPAMRVIDELKEMFVRKPPPRETTGGGFNLMLF